MATQAERDEFARLSAGTTTPIVAVIELPKLADALGERLPWAAPQLRDFDDKLEVWRKSILFGAGGGGTIVQVGTAAPAVPPGVGPPAQYHTLLDANLHTDTVLQAPTRGSLVYGNADATTKWDELVIGATAKYLRSNGTDPSWQTISASDITGLAHNVLSATHTDTLTASVVRGDLIVGNVTPLWSRLGISGSTGKFLKSNGSDPSWQSIVVTDIGSGAALTTISDTNVGLDVSVGGATALLTAAALSVTWNGVLSLLRGGTNNTMTASAGAVVFSNSTQLALTAVGTTGQILVSQGTGTPIWQTAAASGAPVDAEYIVAALNGTLTAERVLTGTANQVNVVFTAGLATLSAPQNIHTAATPTFSGLTLSTFTQGSVIFAGASGVLSQDNANLFWDDTNNRLGIGTNTPAYALHVIDASSELWPTYAAYIQQANPVAEESYGLAVDMLYNNGYALRLGSGSFSTLWLQAGSQALELYTPLIFPTDNTHDIGSSSSSRPKNVYIGGFCEVFGDIVTHLALRTTVTTNAQITTDQNDYAIGEGTFFRLTSDASRTITGITNGEDGTHLIIVNSGSFNIVLANQSASSAAANRIITGTGSNITLLPDERVEATYDATTERWRCGAKVYAGGSGGVTSVDMTVPAFLSVSGNPITTAGTLAVTLSGTALPIANGGTAGTTALAAFNNLSPLTTFGDLLSRNATDNVRIGIGTAGFVLTSNGAGALATWQATSAAAHNLLSATHTDTVADSPVQGDIIYANATPAWTKLAKSTSVKVLHGGDTPSWSAVSLTADVTGRLPFANLAQGAALSVFGVTGNAIADMASIVAGSDFQVVRRSGTSVAFGSINLASTNAVTGTLVVGNGGTGAATFTAFAVICAGTTATGAFQNVSGIGSAGQVLTSSGAGLPTWAAPAAPAIGPGTQYKIPVWATTTTLGDSALISDSGNKTLTYTPSASTTGGPTIFKINGPTHSGVSASFIDADFNLARTVALVSGSTIALAYGVIFRGMDFSSAGVGAHVTRAATVVIENYPRSATLGTLAVDTAYSLWVKEGITAIGNPSASTGQLFFYHASSAFSTGFQSGVATATATYTLPTAGPAADGYILSSTTGGVMSWTSGASHAMLSATHTDTTPATVVVGDLITGQTGPVWAKLTKGATGTILRANATNILYSTFTIPDTYAQGDLIYASATNVLTALAKNASATRYLSNTGTTNNPAWAQVALTTGVTGTLPVANGGTNATSFTAGSVIFAGAGGTSLAQDNANFFWDDTNNRLGLGTASPSQQLQLTGNLRMPATTATAGVIMSDASLFIHAFGTQNAFVGVDAGNLALSGGQIGNSGVGFWALKALTTGSFNTAVGRLALYQITTAQQNSAVGNNALGVCISGSYNTAVGASALASCTVDENTGVGYFAGNAVTTGLYNCFVGYASDVASGSGTLSACVGIGYGAKCTASNQLVIGGSTVGRDITDSYWGQGVTRATPAGITINASGGSGTNNAGAPLKFAGGKGTGSAAGGDIIFYTSNALGSGTTLQSITEKMRLSVTGILSLGVASTATGILKFAHASSALLTGFQAGNATAAVTYTLPTAGGTVGQVLSTDGSAVLSWASVIQPWSQYMTSEGNQVAVGETQLGTVTFSANSLSADGDMIWSTYAFTIVNSVGATKRVKIYFPSANLIFDSGALASTAAGSMIVDVQVIRKSSTSFRYAVSATAASLALVGLSNVGESTGQDFTINNTMNASVESSGGSAADNDVVGTWRKNTIIPAGIH